MDVLVACELSGVVRDAFRGDGHNAWSCDLKPSDVESKFHLVGYCLDVIPKGWDLVIAHPPCTHLAVSGARYFAEKQRDGRQQKAVQFFLDVEEALSLGAERWAIENPVGIMSTLYHKPSQVIQPWMFGHPEVKATCLWLSKLPLLAPTRRVEERDRRLSNLPPSVTYHQR